MTSYPTPGGGPPDHLLGPPVPRDRHHGAGEYAAPGATGDRATGYGLGPTDEDRLWATIAYLGIVFFAFVPPLAVYVVKHAESRFVRYHAAQALNLWITVLLYSVSFAIIGGVLALDTVPAALAVSVPLLAVAGLAMLAYALLAAVAAMHGETYRVPSWICVSIVK